MKSTVTKLADYGDLLNNFKINFELDETMLDKELEIILKKNKLVEAVNQIEKNDLVTVNLISDNKKFNQRKLKLVVGSNYFSETLEERLIGLSVNDEKSYIIDNDKVMVEIIDIKRNSLPKLTDEIIKNENIPGVETIADYKKLFYDDSKANYITSEVIKLSIAVFNKLLKESEFSIFEADVEEMLEEMMNYYRKAAKNEGFELEEMTEAQISKISNAKSYDELLKNETKTSIHLVKITSICSKVLNKDIETIQANRNTVLKLQNEFSNYLREKLAI